MSKTGSRLKTSNHGYRFPPGRLANSVLKKNTHKILDILDSAVRETTSLYPICPGSIKPLAREIHDSDSGTHFTGPINSQLATRLEQHSSFLPGLPNVSPIWSAKYRPVAMKSHPTVSITTYATNNLPRTKKRSY